MIRTALALFLVLAAAPAFGQGAPEAGYLADLAAERAATDAEFRNPATSPLDPRALAVFDGLPYYPAQQEYVVAGRLARDSEPVTIQMPATVGPPQEYLKLGTIRFEMAGAAHTLTAYRAAASAADSLFIPFTDATSGSGTYGGGRYLYVPSPPPGDGPVTLDFNRAFNPYCAFSPAYACAIPPEENALAVAIEAGELAPPAALADALEAPWPDTWTRIEVETGGYAIDFPFPPRPESPRAGIDGRVLNLGSETLFAVSIGMPRPVASPEAAAEILGAMVGEFARDPAAEVLTDEEASLDGAPARAVTVRMADGTRLHLLLAVDTRRVYRLGAVNLPAEIAQRFFDSAERLAPTFVAPPTD